MKPSNIIMIAIGVVLILFAVPIGDWMLNTYLWFGGMPIERSYVVLGGFIRGIQIIGTLAAAFGMLKLKRKEE